MEKGKKGWAGANRVPIHHDKIEFTCDCGGREDASDASDYVPEATPAIPKVAGSCFTIAEPMLREPSFDPKSAKSGLIRPSVAKI